MNLLHHASFFIGLSSGLSWLAWATHIPVVLISGFTLPVSEFILHGEYLVPMDVTDAGMILH